MEDNTSHIVTDDKATARWRWFARRVILVPLCAFILVTIGIWVVVQMNQSSNKKKSVLDNAIAAADSSIQTGDYQKSYDQLKQASDSAQTSSEKVKLYLQLAAAAANAGQFQDAISYLNKRHELDPSKIGEDASIMGSYYEVLEDNANATKQYKLSIEYQKSQPQTQQSRSDIESLEARIASLEESQ